MKQFCSVFTQSVLKLTKKTTRFKPSTPDNCMSLPIEALLKKGEFNEQLFRIIKCLYASRVRRPKLLNLLIGTPHLCSMLLVC